MTKLSKTEGPRAVVETTETDLLARVLGLDRYGMVVRAIEEVESDDGDVELWVLIETSRTVVGCAVCGVRAVSRGRRTVKVRDLEVAGRPVVACWRKRLWRCVEVSCPAGSWTEENDFVPARRQLSSRAAVEICRCVGQENDAVAAAARRFGVSWSTAMAAVETHGRPLVDDPARTAVVTALGIDETKMLAARRTARTRWVSGFVDLDTGGLIDLVQGRDGADITGWLDTQPASWRAQVDVVAIDPHRGYYNAVTTGLDALVVVDPFHVIRLANRRIDQTRRRIQNDTLGHRGRRGDPLYAGRKLLLMGDDRHNAESWARLRRCLDQGDPAGELGAVWVGKELLRDVYTAATRREAHQLLVRFYTWCADNADIPELVSLAHVIERWEAEILAFFDSRYTNARTENLNLAIKDVKRIGRGFVNFQHYRLRVLLHTGVDWNTRLPTRLRTRRPRSAA